ncbi:hypothetical protein Vi05172_g12773 [Venturia inaequalis]|nr:hypothetical protein Vi05172_g12773 [Venturia inaequalis]
MPYVYGLQTTASSFCILEFLPGSEDEEVFYPLNFAEWKSPPPYEAIS